MCRVTVTRSFALVHPFAPVLSTERSANNVSKRCERPLAGKFIRSNALQQKGSEIREEFCDDFQLARIAPRRFFESTGSRASFSRHRDSWRPSSKSIRSDEISGEKTEHWNVHKRIHTLTYLYRGTSPSVSIWILRTSPKTTK